MKECIKLKINQTYTNNLYLANQRNVNQQKMQEVDTKLSTGKVTSSPTHIGKMTQLGGAIPEREITQNELDESQSYLNTVQAVLETGNEVGVRLKELATQYQSDTISKEEQRTIYKEVKGLTNELKDMFGSATFNGEKIFTNNNKEGIHSKLQLDMPDMSFLDELKGKLEVGEITTAISNSLDQSLTNIQQLKTTSAYNTAIEAYKKTMGTQTTTDLNNVQTQTPTSTTGTTYAESFISDLVSNTLKDVLSENEEVLDYLTSKSPVELYTELKEQSYENLQSLAKEYGFEEEFNFLEKLGVLDLIGIQKGSTNLPEEPTEPNNDVETPEETITTPANPVLTDNESEDGLITIENPIGGVVDEVTDTIEEGVEGTTAITDDILEEAEEWLNPEYVEEMVLDVIGNVQADVEIKTRILEFRQRYEERIQEIQEERMARMKEDLVEKELIEKSKLTILKEVNSYLLQWNLTQQQRMIDLLF